MRRTLTALAALAVAVVVAAPAAAFVIPSDQPCTPSDAWVEEVQHPAVGEPTVEVPNPEYVPATSTRVHYTWTGGKTSTAPPIDSAYWQPTSGTPNGKPHQQPDDHVYRSDNSGKATSAWFVWRTVTTPEQGTPTITVPNPEYVPEYTELLQHEGVVCEPETEPTVPVVELSPEPSEPVVEEPNEGRPDGTPGVCEGYTEAEALALGLSFECGDTEPAPAETPAPVPAPAAPAAAVVHRPAFTG